MGAEKALIPFRGRPLVLWSMSVLDKVAQELIVSVSPDPSEELLGALVPSATIVRDERPGRYNTIRWSELRGKRTDGDYADYGPEVQIAQYRI